VDTPASPPDTHPLQARREKAFERRARAWIGGLLAVALHLFLLFLLLWPGFFRLSGAPTDDGWAQDIALSETAAPSDGFAGQSQSEQRAASEEEWPDHFAIRVVWVPPATNFAPEPETEVIPPPVPTDIPVDQLPEPKAEKPREAPKPPEPQIAEAEPATEAPGTGQAIAPPAEDQGAPSDGGSGSQDAPAGSPEGTGQGSGTGRTDPSDRPGTQLVGDAISDAVQGWTLQGTEGAWDGSTPDNSQTRIEFRWEAYYDPNGTVEVRYETFGVGRPRGPVRVLLKSDEGPYRVVGNQLCQNLKDLSYGLPVCFEVHLRDGNKVAMYYVTCDGLTRCYPGRLGPSGIVVPGRQFTLGGSG
jgi:outer membrane biosynthesis protein TonB